MDTQERAPSSLKTIIEGTPEISNMRACVCGWRIKSGHRSRHRCKRDTYISIHCTTYWRGRRGYFVDWFGKYLPTGYTETRQTFNITINLLKPTERIFASAIDRLDLIPYANKAVHKAQDCSSSHFRIQFLITNQSMLFYLNDISMAYITMHIDCMVHDEVYCTAKPMYVWGIDWCLYGKTVRRALAVYR